MAFADNAVHPVDYGEPLNGRLGPLPGPFQLGQIGNGFNDTDKMAVFIFNDTGVFDHGHIMAILVPQQAFIGLGPPAFQDSAFFNAGRAVFAKTPTALEQSAGLAQRFGRRVTADALHGWIPGTDPALVIQGENPIGHGVDDPVDKADIPNLLDRIDRSASHETIALVPLPIVTKSLLPNPCPGQQIIGIAETFYSYGYGRSRVGTQGSTLRNVT